METARKVGLPGGELDICEVATAQLACIVAIVRVDLVQRAVDSVDDEAPTRILVTTHASSRIHPEGLQSSLRDPKVIAELHGTRSRSLCLQDNLMNLLIVRLLGPLCRYVQTGSRGGRR